MKALTEKVYWVPGVRSDSTIVVVLSAVVTEMPPSPGEISNGSASTNCT